MRYNFRYRMTGTPDHLPLIKKWCEENYGKTFPYGKSILYSEGYEEVKRWSYQYHGLDEIVILIRDEEDAMAFKLKWL